MSAIQPDVSSSIPASFAGHHRVTGPAQDAPMSIGQIAELLCLSQRAEDPSAFDETLTSTEADARIARLKRQLEG